MSLRINVPIVVTLGDEIVSHTPVPLMMTGSSALFQKTVCHDRHRKILEGRGKRKKEDMWYHRVMREVTLRGDAW